MPRTWAVAALVGLTAASSAVATPLNLTLLTPDITSGFLNVNYNATTDVLVITGPALTYEIAGGPPPDHAITGGTFTLNATINSSGVMSAGTLTITGSIGAIGATSPLLTANLAGFGFSNAPVTQFFEFTGAVTGGSLAGSFGSTVGTVVNVAGAFPGNFNSNFSRTGQGSADTARIPAPGGALALAMGAGLLARRRRR